uniref:hypothetical protein n=1 Tax=Arthrobacter sp. TaxID=1667 RepID=UPI000EB6FC00|nr:hypothetical protein [Arthrobacter sp.]AXV46315.1 hypothetical protein pA40H1_p28 [Arthrobacter sp.]
MRTITRTALVLAGTAALVGTMALPASAAPTDTTETTVLVDSGTIDIVTPVDATSSLITAGSSATISLPGIVVTDSRAGTASWSASVHMTPLTGEIVDNVLAPTSADYLAEAAVTSGEPAMAPVASVSVLEATDDERKVAVQTATTVVGNNTATWDATLTVVTPEQVLADTYTATLTHSVL